MKRFSKIFALLLVAFFAIQNVASAHQAPLLRMTAVKAECKKIGNAFKVVLTITLDNYSYGTYGPNIQYTIAGGGAPQILLASSQVSTSPNIHEFQGVNLSAGITYSITADIPPFGGSGGVGGNTLTFVPIMNLCAGVTTITIDSSLAVVLPHKPPCPTLVNLVKNGNFMYGIDGSFQSDLPPGCGACSAGSYCTGKEFRTKCSSWPANTWDHTLGTASGSYLLVDGNPSQPSTVWFTNVPVCKGVTYTFSFWAKSLYTDPFTLGLMINSTTVPVSTVTVAGASAWRQYSITWTCPLPTGTMVQIGIEQLTAGHKRDFGIDDIFFGFCCECNKP